MYKLKRKEHIITTYDDRYGSTYAFLRQGFECRPYVNFDNDGVALLNYSQYNYLDGLKLEYNIGSICQYALENIFLFERTKEAVYLNNFTVQLQWLLKNKKSIQESIFWSFDYDYADVKAPWVSGMISGLAVSCLSKGYIYTDDDSLLQLALAAANFYEIDISDGGFTVFTENDGIYFRQYTNCDPWRAHSLNGYLVAILGLLDLNRIVNDKKIEILLVRSLYYLKRRVYLWESGKGWTNIYHTQYGVSKSIDYHIFHTELMYALAIMRSDSELYDIYKRWSNLEPEVALEFAEYTEREDLLSNDQTISDSVKCDQISENEELRNNQHYSLIKRLMSRF
jgi:hypothetical protein